MLKNILKLDGAQQLSKNEQKEITGGVVEDTKKCDRWCPWPKVCHDDGVCRVRVEG